MNGKIHNFFPFFLGGETFPLFKTTYNSKSYKSSYHLQLQPVYHFQSQSYDPSSHVNPKQHDGKAPWAFNHFTAALLAPSTISTAHLGCSTISRAYLGCSTNLSSRAESSESALAPPGETSSRPSLSESAPGKATWDKMMVLKKN